MAGSRLSLLLVVLMLGGPGVAAAQSFLYQGMLTAHIGTVSGGDVHDSTVSGGAALSVLDLKGLGAELDIAHFGDFDDETFSDSSVTNLMLNFVAVYPHPRFRPFVNVGAGAVRLRATPPGLDSRSSTEAAWNAGGGLHFMANDIFGIRADVRYFRLFTTVEDFALRDAGFFDFWRTSVGVTLAWPMR